MPVSQLDTNSQTPLTPSVVTPLKREKQSLTKPAVHHNSETKGREIVNQYAAILQGHILGLGEEQTVLKPLLPTDAHYLSIRDAGNSTLNTIEELLPFDDHRFDCVVCLDVLQSLKNVQQLFDELCRVSRSYVMISVPIVDTETRNISLKKAPQQTTNSTVHSTAEPQREDSQWCLSRNEAMTLIEQRAARNLMQVIQVDCSYDHQEEKRLSVMDKLLRGLNLKQTVASGTLWAVIQHSPVTEHLRP